MVCDVSTPSKYLGEYSSENMDEIKPTQRWVMLVVVDDYCVNNYRVDIYSIDIPTQSRISRF